MDQVAQVKERTDIIGLISEYIQLKKMGRNFKTTCPFHNEKTPSFVVSPERQIWHCFGCNKGGDVYTFLMEYEKLEFPEVLRILAKKAGVEIKTSAFQTGLTAKKEKIYKLNSLASDFYHYILRQHKVGKRALSYLLKKRGLNLGLIETFRLGFSPKAGNALSNFLIKKKGYKKEDLVEGGLAFYPSRPLGASSGSPISDFFRNRVMFPLLDQRGNIVGFSGRVLEEVPNVSKYVNTKETLVYHKGSQFFGLTTAKDEIKKEDKAIIVEGEFDVISLFSIGIKNAVAVKGTALTENQANLLSRFTKNVALCFDKDAAGYEATRRSLSTLEKQGLVVTAVEISNGKDADEAIKNDPLLFRKSLKKEVGIYDYFFEKLVLSEDLKTIEGKRRSFEMLPLITGIENAIVKEHYLKKLSAALETSYESIVKELEKLEKKESVSPDLVTPKKDKKERREILEEYLLSLLVQSKINQDFFEHLTKILKDYKFIVPAIGKIINLLFLFLAKNENLTLEKFAKTLPPEIIKTFDLAFIYPLPYPPAGGEGEKMVEGEIIKVASEAKALFIKDRIRFLSEDLKHKEKDKKEREIENLQKELSILISLLKAS